jgi:hypothetical protein
MHPGLAASAMDEEPAELAPLDEPLEEEDIV